MQKFPFEQNYPEKCQLTCNEQGQAINCNFTPYEEPALFETRVLSPNLSRETRPAASEFESGAMIYPVSLLLKVGAFLTIKGDMTFEIVQD